MKLKLNVLISLNFLFLISPTRSHKEEGNVVHPVLVRENNMLLDEDISKFRSYLSNETRLYLRIDELVLDLGLNEKLVNQDAIVERKFGNSLSKDRIRKVKSDHHQWSCAHLSGSVRGVPDSLAAITLCSNGMVSTE